VLVWAGNLPIMKLVVGDVGPLTFAALRGEPLMIWVKAPLVIQLTLGVCYA